MFNYPWGVFSITLGSMGSVINYPGEYVQLPWGACSTTLGSMINYPLEYVELPWGVCSTTLESMFNYHGKNVQLPFLHPRRCRASSRPSQSTPTAPPELLRAPSGPSFGQRRKLTISERVQGQILTTLPAKINVSEHATGSTGINVRKCSRSLPSTLAGGQDDVSSQANSLKLKTSGH